jgi:predicted extracellular nuclease
MPAFPRNLALATGLGLVSSALILLPTPAQAAGPGLVISEVYGAGNSGATSEFQNDFVELQNTSGSPISLLGKSLQARGVTGTGIPTQTNVFPLPDVEVPAGGKFLVAGAGGTTNGAPLPTPDATSTLSLANNNGQVFLADTTDPVDPNARSGSAGNGFSAQVLDFVGWGNTATSFEGSAPGPGTGLSTGVTRASDGADTDNNGPDLSLSSPPVPEACGCAQVPDELEATIAEVQGTDTGTSPHLYDTVTTEGVVTAAYPAGGFNGFYLQTGGAPATPGASDAVFVSMGNVVNSAYPLAGESVEVTGQVIESAGSTQINVTQAADVVDLPALPAVAALDVPWTSLDSAAEKEEHEGELVAPRGAFTVTNVFNTNRFAEIGLAQGNTPLVQPTEVEDAQTGQVAAVAAQNAARMITLDDGASTDYAPNTPNPGSQGQTLPWLTRAGAVRVGDAASLNDDLVLDYRNNLWKLQPRARVTGAGASVATFTDSRPDNLAPENVGGDIRLATFNVLNYFPTTGEEFVAADPGNSCTYFLDRASTPIANNSCTPDGPRGAATAASLARQQDKIVTAINGLQASIVSLEELENSVKLGKDRDFAIDHLVDALNADAGADTWAYAPSPAPADRPAPAEEDVIRTGFIYKPADVALVGEPQILRDEANFDNAREPLAQAFKPAGGVDTQAFAVIVNHFKSKSSGDDDGTGQGLANADRVGQAEALATFASEFADGLAAEEPPVFLAGDFNAYTMEDPMQVLYDEGYETVESDTAGEETYSFSGLSGSLDHVLANTAAVGMVTGADIWDINASESVAYQYSRFNYNVTDFFDGALPFAASDHNPELVGLDLPDASGLVESTTAAAVLPGAVRAGSGTARIDVDVSGAGGTPTGTVSAFVGSRLLDSMPLAAGSATLRVGPFPTAGTRAVEIRYGGDATFAASQTALNVRVDKARPAMTVKKSPRNVVMKKTRAKIAVVVRATGLTPTGQVTAKLGRRVLDKGNLRGGRLTLTLPKFKKKGSFVVSVVYAGNANVDGVAKKVTVRVKRR